MVYNRINSFLTVSEKIHQGSSYRSYHFTSRFLSIEVVNNYARRVIGSYFLNLSDQEKKVIIMNHAFEEYAKAGIDKSHSLIEAERKLQLYIANRTSFIDVTPGLIAKSYIMNLYWTKHSILVPFKQTSIECNFADKDLALDSLSKLIEEGKVKIDNEMLLRVDGCDNNEAATKLRIYLEDRHNKKTYMVATDINLEALAMARGLESFVQRQRREIGIAPFESSDFIVRDAFNSANVLNNNRSELLSRINLIFRLSIIAPRLTTSNVVGLTDFIRFVIDKNSMCVMHFLKNSNETQKTLQKNYKHHSLTLETIHRHKVLYSKGNVGNAGLYLWERDQLEFLISELGGNILSFNEAVAIDDLNGIVNVFTVIVEKKEKS